MSQLVHGCWPRFEAIEMADSWLVVLIVVDDLLGISPGLRRALPVDQIDGESFGVAKGDHMATSRCIVEGGDGTGARKLHCLLQLFHILDLECATQELLFPFLGEINVLVAAISTEPDAILGALDDEHAKVTQESYDAVEVWVLVSHV